MLPPLLHATQPGESTIETRPLRFGVELDLVQPFLPTIHIIKPKVAFSLWGSPSGPRGDLIAGIYLRPHIEHDVVFTIDEYMLVAGYRQYVWRGLHAEVLLDAGLAWGTNRIDGQFYRTPTLFLEVNAGYRFGFFEPGGIVAGTGPGFFIAPQFGFLTSLGVSSIGPRGGKPDWFLQGNLLVGLAF
jgi:hypothetical protein